MSRTDHVPVRDKINLEKQGLSITAWLVKMIPTAATGIYKKDIPTLLKVQNSWLANRGRPRNVGIAKSQNPNNDDFPSATPVALETETMLCDLRRLNKKKPYSSL